MNIRIEEWNGHKIRFIEKEPSEWWAVAKDVAVALGYKHTPHMNRRLDEDEKSAVRLTDTIGRKQKMNVISEIGIYEAIFGSELKEAKTFKKWVKNVIKELREQSGLEGFQIFRTLDKEHQKETMERLRNSSQTDKKVNFIKANTIANKAISTKYGYKKMVKKKDMTPEMLIERQPILDATVNLMCMKKEFDFDFSISNKIYEKYTTELKEVSQ